MLKALLQREALVVFRSKEGVLNPLAFLFLSVLVFGIAAPLNDRNGGEYGVGVLWVLVLLTNLLSLDALFRRDYDSGVLEQALLNAQTPWLFVMLRILSQWVCTGLIMTLTSPLLGILLGIPTNGLPVLGMALMVGTPAISLLGAIGAGLTVGFGRGGVLLALLVLPLFIPVLIFGVGAVKNVLDDANYWGQIYILAALSLAGLISAPFATLASLKISVAMR
jgi:heme exporter protein B|tara:strand:+ start:3236 stop:3901 length:666 start_codon:yes stop_codon:yes gene_type:complete